MAASTPYLAIFLSLILLYFVSNSANAQLRVGFYSKTCPQAELIVNKVVNQTMSVAPSLAGPLLRMHFHDCFVRGCDGSLLLNATSSQQVEKDAIPNKSLRGYQIIDKVKSALEKACPGIVSCADTIAMVARDVTVASKGPYWAVETGRRDGIASIGSDTLTNLAAPSANISTLIRSFHAKGLDSKDLAVLSGAHTIGISPCSSFGKRLYNFTGKGLENDSDPSLDSEYVERLKLKCKPDDEKSIVRMDPGSSKIFDSSYFSLVSKRRGLFQSDAALLDNDVTKNYINFYAAGKKSSFFEDFGASMVKMGRVGVLTGSEGEIRKVCSRVNSLSN